MSAENNAAILKQIEFYFSDSNVRKDKFLKQKIAENPEGYVPISVLLTFKRLQALTTDVSVVAAAIKDSAEVELNSAEDAIRRSRPVPESDDSEARSVYVKGPFPSSSTLDEMIAFANQYGNAKVVTMRRARIPDRPFKGSIFIEYATVEEAKEFLEKFAKGEILFESRSVEKAETLQTYFERKRNERESRRGNKEAAAKVPTKVFEKTLTPGVIVKLSNLSDSTNMGSLTEFLQTLGDLKFVEFDTETKIAHLRWEHADDANKCIEALKVGGETLTAALGTSDAKFEVLTGEEEQKYWEIIWDLQLKRFNAHRQKGGRGGRGRGGKRGRNDRDNNPPSKRANVE